MRFPLRTFAIRLCPLFLAFIALTAIAAQQPSTLPPPAKPDSATSAPAPQTPAAQTPDQPATGKKPKKKKSQPSTPASAPSALGEETYHVTLRAQNVTGNGGLSYIDVRITAGRHMAAGITGQTDSNGVFEADLPADDYTVFFEQGTTTVRQTVHVDAASSKLVLINLPPSPVRSPSGPTGMGGVPH